MSVFPPNPIRCLVLAVLMLTASAWPASAQTLQLTDEQLRAIDYHYKMDQYFVAGCLTGATFGAITGLMTLAGVSVIAAVPYISTGCSVGFLIGGTVMVVGDFVSTHLHHGDDGDSPQSAPAN
jgi:hypothetical protein